MYTIRVVKCVTKSSSGLIPPCRIPVEQVAIIKDNGLDEIKELLAGFLADNGLVIDSILQWNQPSSWRLNWETTAYVKEEVKDVKV